jgi:hypothetical protein
MREEESVRPPAAASDIECGGSGSSTGGTISMFLSCLAPDGRELLESTFAKHSTPTIPSFSLGFVGCGLTLVLVWMPLKGLLLPPPRKTTRMVVHESARSGTGDSNEKLAELNSDAPVADRGRGEDEDNDKGCGEERRGGSAEREVGKFWS